MPPRLTGPTVRPTAEPARPIQPNALQVAGGIVQGVGQATDRLAKEVQRLDEIRVNEALAEYALGVDTLLNDPRDGILQKRGKDAMKAFDGFRDTVSVRRSDVMAGLGNENQRALFQAQSERLVREADRRAFNYLDTETRRADAESTQALTSRDLQQVAALAGDTKAVDELLKGMRQRLMLFGDRQGQDRVVTEQAIADLRSNARLAQVEALAGVDPEKASEVLTAHLDEIAPDKRAQARKFVDNATMDVRSQAERDKILVEFPDDEQAALKAVRDRYEGEMEDEVTRRVRAVYAQNRETVTQRGNDLLERAIQLAGPNGNLDALPLELRTTLQTQYPTKWRAFTDYARQVQNGTAIVTDLSTLQDLMDKTPDEWLKLDLNDYRAKLSYEDFRQLLTYQRGIRNPNTGASRAGMTRPEIESYIFTQAQQMGMFPRGVSSLAQLNNSKTTKDEYLQLRANIFDSIKAAAEKGPLTQVEIEGIVNGIVDDRVLRTSQTNVVRPRAAILPGMESRELTARDSSRFNITPRTRPATQRERADRYEQLRDQGMTPEQATAQVNREMP